MKLAVITSGFLPVPATKGGAVENIIVNLLNENEKYKKIEFSIFSVYDKTALDISKFYKKAKFKFIKIPNIIKLTDRCIFFIANNILKKKNSHSYRYIFQRLYFLYKCSNLLNQNNYDKVLLENHPSQYLALKWHKNNKQYEGNYYYHCHNEIPGSYRCYDIIKNTKKIICVSEFRKNTVKNYWNLKDNQLVVLKNSIDSNKIIKKANAEEIKEIRNKFNINASEKVLIYTGRIVPGKGVKELIESIKLIKHKNFKLLILGASLNSLNVKNEYEKEIYSSIDENIKNKIIFTGFINYDELYKYYSLADIAVLPSIMDDSAPLSIVEALCCGIPIITTDSGGIPEYATNGSAIILKRDKYLVNNIAKSIDSILGDDKKRKEMSKISKNISKNLTLNKFYEEFYKYIYD